MKNKLILFTFLLSLNSFAQLSLPSFGDYKDVTIESFPKLYADVELQKKIKELNFFEGHKTVKYQNDLSKQCQDYGRCNHLKVTRIRYTPSAFLSRVLNSFRHQSNIERLNLLESNLFNQKEYRLLEELSNL